jgi:hypothetical protein
LEALVPGGFAGVTGVDAEMLEMLMDRILGLSHPTVTRRKRKLYESRAQITGYPGQSGHVVNGPSTTTLKL